MVRVSVIIPCYNREHLLGATLDSLRAQTFTHWEGIVVDDNSQDASVEVTRRYAGMDGRICSVLRQGDRRGGNICRNQGLALAQGELIVFLDSDDLLAPTCLERRVAAMDREPKCGFGVFQTELFTETVGDLRLLWNAYTDASDLKRFLNLDNVWLTTGPIWRKEAIRSLGGFDEALPSFQDWDINVRALMSGLGYFKDPLRDNFHRHGSVTVKAITDILGIHPDHLRSHEKLFAKTYDKLRAAGLLDDEMRGHVTGLFWWLARRWWEIGKFQEADQVWRHARDLGLCGRWQYLEGRLILKLYHVRGGGRLALLIQRSWPRQSYRFYSEHLKKTPVDKPEPAVAALATAPARCE